jgi:SAM-dependent methyltransferase
MSSSVAQYDQMGVYYEWAYGGMAPATEADDLKLYVRLARESKCAVLEMGSGSGRICVELARQGIRVTGIELSGAMIAIANERVRQDLSGAERDNLEMVQDDMCTTRLGKTFGLIIFPYSSLLELQTLDQAGQAVQNAYSMLDSGGTLVVDAFYYGPGGPNRPDGVLRRGRRLPQEDGSVLQFSETDFCYAEGPTVVSERWLYADMLNTQSVVTERRLFAIRRIYLSPEQMESLLASSSFANDNIRVYGSFDAQTPLDAPCFQDKTDKRFGKARQIWICRKF